MHGVGLIGRCDQHIRGYALLDPPLQSEHCIMFGIERYGDDERLPEIDRAGAA
jgi:hypothetical protein